MDVGHSFARPSPRLTAGIIRIASVCAAQLDILWLERQLLTWVNEKENDTSSRLNDA